MSDETQTIIDALDKLLEKERQLLLGGELDQIETVLAEKEALIDRFQAQPEPAGDALQTLQSKVQRNHMLLGSAMAGIRAVARRFADIRQAQNSFETYDKSGKRTSIRTHRQSTVEKRA